MPQGLRLSSRPEVVLQTITSGSVPMAGWSSSAGDEFKVGFRDPIGYLSVHGDSNLDQNLRTNPVYNDKQKEIFNQVLTTCLKEYPQTRTRPLPVIISDGKLVDLYELSTRVKERGGFEFISTNKMWTLIAGDLGFDLQCAPSLKLVYAKYLKLVDRWLQRVGNQRTNGVSLGHLDKKRNGQKLFSSDLKQEVKIHLGDLFQDIDGQNFYEVDVVKESSSDRQPVPSGKRRNDSLFGVLEWIKRVARNPCDPAKGQGSKGSKQNEDWVQECWDRAGKIREVLFVRRQECSSGDQLYTQKKQKIHPSLYEGSVGADHQALDRLRATQKRMALYGFQQSPCASPSVTSFSPGNHTGSFVFSNPTCLDIQPVQRSQRQPSSVCNGTTGHDLLSLERVPRKRIPIGPYFQAVVPPWNGPPKQQQMSSGNEIGLDDARWLGTQTWPVKGWKRVVNKGRIGKGRSRTCLCDEPASIECVRLHVQEERERLKSELGPAFFTWRFDDMGEDVSRSWMPEEERKFRALVRLNPVSLDKNFWNHLPACFPSKSMEMLVSYYFNVFVLRRRSIQNRTMPGQIDSDDDEAEFGSVENFNMQGMLNPGAEGSVRLSQGNDLGETSGTLVCRQNMQDSGSDMFGEREYTWSLPHRENQNGICVQKQHEVPCLNYGLEYLQMLEGKSGQRSGKVKEV